MSTPTEPELAWLREQLARYTYRPGWRMSIGAGEIPYGPAVLIVKYPAIDSRRGSEGRFEARRPIQPTADPEQFARDLQTQLHTIEIHESDEWLRRDGELYDDPHADPARWQCPCGGVGPVREGNSWTCPGCGTTQRWEKPA